MFRSFGRCARKPMQFCVSIVFYNHDLRPNGQSPSSDSTRCLPRYLDLTYYAAQQGIPFTFSSNLLHALQAALKHGTWDKRFAALRETMPWLRAGLNETGFQLVASDETGSPAILTLALPEWMDSVRIGNLMHEAGY